VVPAQWQALLTQPEQQAPFKAKLQALFDLLEPQIPHEKNPGVLNGQAGYALFYGWYASYSGQEAYAQKAQECMERAFDTVENEQTGFDLGNGVTGIALALLALVQKGIIEANPVEALEGLDAFMMQAFTHVLPHNYDYLAGALGPAFFFLNFKELPGRAAHIERCVEGFAAHLHWQKEMAWLVSQDHHRPGHTVINPSLSHGMGALIIWLAQVVKEGLGGRKAQMQLKGLVAFIRSLAQPTEGGANRYVYPNMVSDTEGPVPGRLAWCYGDMGIAHALWLAGQALQDAELQNHGLAVMLHNAQNRDPEKDLVVDADLCHGAFGLGHNFNRYYHLTGHKELQEAALYWMETGLKMDTHDQGLAGYSHYYGQRGWHNNYGLLEGIAGIGLSLMAAMQGNQAPSWDRVLLLS